MALHFERTEFEHRMRRTLASLAEQSLDAMLLFAPESHYWLTGYDTSGYVFFQCLVLTADGQLTLLTRPPDVAQAGITSTIEDVRVWYDTADADPSHELAEILAGYGLAGGRVGVELRCHGLTGHAWELVRQRLGGWCALEDASNLVRELRVRKSSAEIGYVRRAARLADEALLAMLDGAVPGAFEGDIAAAGDSVILRGGGDPAPSGPVLGSGERALLIRSATGYRRLDDIDQLTIEFAASFRRYCACLMRTVAVGGSTPRQQRMFEVTREALVAMTAAVQVGRPLGEVDDAHRRVFDAAGFGASRMSACGYSLGATFRPTWMDVPPMLYSGNPMPAAPGMVLFLHAILVDRPAGLAMSLGHTVLVGERSTEALSGLPLEWQGAGTPAG